MQERAVHGKADSHRKEIMGKRLLAHILTVPLLASCGVPMATDREPLSEAAPAATVTVKETVKETITARPKVAQSTSRPTPAATIEDGTWIVGEDIPPGQYRVRRAITEDLCYWKISRLGSNGDDIIANELGPKGRPLVTLRKGQEFSTERCGVWVKR